MVIVTVRDELVHLVGEMLDKSMSSIVLKLLWGKSLVFISFQSLDKSIMIGFTFEDGVRFYMMLTLVGFAIENFISGSSGGSSSDSSGDSSSGSSSVSSSESNVVTDDGSENGTSCGDAMLKSNTN
ncbi:hypothetical protein DICPUDRAFT_153010 [Dictyostelium purpureum]|uniref:Uncharacterized protein n=1 Tax=Dictyostelium purpureum TaxID=5786 RepID=F0ZMU6_DICPU|nr:uncharacterized protein DICPUDRAFT_153010 [Dictyostelium purpureum]EGC34735.1 hypothetical protein DICPUDRAFT_153010 [Dictyostelium purpureum]|eukprot:XP_003288735.1 hypothetical protein DICPUDRAFT_153010 [Dictyostelium purpureum]